MAGSGERVRVWISYSHDDEAHSERVLRLSERLRGDGIDCWIDQYEQADDSMVKLTGQTC